MLKNVFVLLTLLSLSIYFAGSSNDDENPVDPKVDSQPQNIVVKPVETPASMQQNQEVDVRTLSLLSMVNSVSLYGGLYTTPGNAELSGNNEWSGSWSDGSATCYWESWEDGDVYYVELSVSGVYDGESVSDFLLVDLEAYDEGESGTLTIYDPAEENSFSYDWYTDDDNVYYLSYYFTDGSELYARSNPDLSGEIEYYENGASGTVLTYRAEWNSDGSGNWESWDLDGNYLGGGNW